MKKKISITASILFVLLLACTPQKQVNTNPQPLSGWHNIVNKQIIYELNTLKCPESRSGDRVSAEMTLCYKFVEQIPIEKEWDMLRPLVKNCSDNAEILMVNEKHWFGYETSLPSARIFVYENGTPTFYACDLINNTLKKDTINSIEELQISYWIERKWLTNAYKSYCIDAVTVFTVLDKYGNLKKIKSLVAFCD